MRTKTLLINYTIIFSTLLASLAVAQEKFGNLPQYIKRKHFIIYHDNRTLANRLSWKAEYYYKQILRHLNVEGFDPFGQKPCPIYLYKNKSEFLENTDAPQWSGGIAKYNPPRFATYEGAPHLEDATFPHELTHLLLFILMEGHSIPLWLNEGLAQYEEADFGKTKKPYLRRMIKSDNYIKLRDLFEMQVYPEDKQKIRLFYAEVASVVEFLKEKSLRRTFGQFLLKIKRGLGTEEALKEVYQWKFSGGIEELEERWISFVLKSY
jgi:hypothetical protein